MDDPDTLRQYAADLRAAAAALRNNPLFGIRQTTGPHVWQGPAANQFNADLRRYEQTLQTAIQRIEDTARQLTTQADQLHQVKRAL